MTKILAVHPGDVSQADLENIITIKAQIDRYNRMLERVSTTVLHRITTGATVEDGQRWYEVEEYFEEGIKKQKLLVS